MTDERDWAVFEERLVARLGRLPENTGEMVKVEIATAPEYVECGRGTGDRLRAELRGLQRRPATAEPAELRSALEAAGWAPEPGSEGPDYWAEGPADDAGTLAALVVGTFRRALDVSGAGLLRLSVSSLVTSPGSASPTEAAPDYEEYVRGLSPEAQRQEKDQIAAERWFLQRAAAEIAVANYQEHGDTPPALDALVDLLIERGERLTPQRAAEVCEENPFMVAAILPIAQQQAAAWDTEAAGTGQPGAPEDAVVSRRDAAQAAKAWAKMVKVLTRAQRRLPQIPADWQAG